MPVPEYAHDYKALMQDMAPAFEGCKEYTLVDSEVEVVGISCIAAVVEISDVARKLERERDEAREQLEAMRSAFMAAKAFIDCHVADPDITAEMVQTYGAYQDALAKLQPHLS